MKFSKFTCNWIVDKKCWGERCIRLEIHGIIIYLFAWLTQEWWTTQKNSKYFVFNQFYINISISEKGKQNQFHSFCRRNNNRTVFFHFQLYYYLRLPKWKQRNVKTMLVCGWYAVWEEMPKINVNQWMNNVISVLLIVVDSFQIVVSYNFNCSKLFSQRYSSHFQLEIKWISFLYCHGLGGS